MQSRGISNFCLIIVRDASRLHELPRVSVNVRHFEPCLQAPETEGTPRLIRQLGSRGGYAQNSKRAAKRNVRGDVIVVTDDPKAGASTNRTGMPNPAWLAMLKASARSTTAVLLCS